MRDENGFEKLVKKLLTDRPKCAKCGKYATILIRGNEYIDVLTKDTIVFCPKCIEDAMNSGAYDDEAKE